MGKLLGVKVVAEGVEEESQLNLLQSYGCQFYQGYYFSRPQPNEIFETMLVKELEVNI